MKVGSVGKDGTFTDLFRARDFVSSLRDWLPICRAVPALTRWANVCRRFAASVVVAIGGQGTDGKYGDRRDVHHISTATKFDLLVR